MSGIIKVLLGEINRGGLFLDSPKIKKQNTKDGSVTLFRREGVEIDDW